MHTKHYRRPALKLLLLSLLLPAAARLPCATALAQDWPQQGGPDRNYVLPARNLNLDFTTRPRVKYAINAGFGISQPIVVGDKLYCTGLFPLGTNPESIDSPSDYIRSSDAFDNQRKLPSAREHDLDGAPAYVSDYGGPRGEEWLCCRDLQTGKLLWASRLTDQVIVHRENNVVSEEAAPAYSGGRIYVHVLTGLLFCVDASDGKVQWYRNLFEAQMYQWAMKQGNVAGPLVCDGTVIVSFNAQHNLDYSRWDPGCIGVAGFDARTGKTRWITRATQNALRPNNGRLGFARLSGTPTVLVPSGQGTTGLDPATGKTLWSWRTPSGPGGVSGFAWTSYSPVAWENYVFDAVDDGHDDAPSQSWCLKIDDNNNAQLAWSTHDFKPYSFIQKANVIVSDGKLYGIDSRTYGNDDGKRDKNLPPGRGLRAPDESGKVPDKFQCRDIRTGKLLWSSDFGKDNDGSTVYFLLAGTQLLATSHTGLWTARITDQGLTDPSHLPLAAEMAEPVLTGTTLFLRQQDLRGADSLGIPEGKANLFCLDLSK